MKKIFQQIGRLLNRTKQETVPFSSLFADFKQLLELNNQILDLIADANDKLSGDYIFDEQYIHDTCAELTDLVRKLIVIINQLTGQRYMTLFPRFRSIEQDLEILLNGGVLYPVADFTLPYSAVSRDLIDAVGGKNAHIAETGSLLGLAIPEGFAVTTSAFATFWAFNDLDVAVAELYDRWKNGDLSLEQASSRIQALILEAPLPPRLRKEILEAAAKIADNRKDSQPCFAVRSSALGEDGSISFAGQYTSRLGIPLEGLPAAYREVVAGLYSPEAVEYRQQKDFRPGEVLMSAACQLMIPAKASGVLYTCDPLSPENETMIINAAWGLGEPIVSGQVPTDHFVLDRKPPHEEKEMQIVRKDRSLVLQGCGTMNSMAVREEQRLEPSLKKVQLEKLAHIGLQLEKYFKKPQDVEFAVDQDDRLVVLQSRQLGLHRKAPARACDLTGKDGQYPILIRGSGVAAMDGIAAGPVWIFEEKSSLEDFPLGAILVARHASPQLARVIHKASGVITDVGSTTGHLATVAREYRVPALFNVEGATEILKNGQEITVDAECLTIFGGIYHELQSYGLQEEPIEEMYEYRLLRRVLKKIEPLNLFAPEDDNFTPEGCLTYHDITRFIHEKAVETIIDLGYYHAHDKDAHAGRLHWEFPLDLVLIDVGGGVRDDVEGDEIVPEMITSVPMQELLRGMSYPGIWDMTPAKVDFSSFMSSLTRTRQTRTASPEDVGRNLAIVSHEYTNINFRLGYHFTVIDAYVADRLQDNHIYFRFSGGVTDTVRRSRRTRLLEEILSAYDFRCELHGDIIVARLKGLDKDGMLRRLFLLGLLVGFTRQLDVQMVNEARIGEYYNFIKNLMEKENENDN